MHVCTDAIDAAVCAYSVMHTAHPLSAAGLHTLPDEDSEKVINATDS
jgi:hypothetical protein